MFFNLRQFAAFIVIAFFAPFAAAVESGASQDGDETPRSTTPAVAPDIRDDDVPLTVESGNVVVVPIPMSNPTLETGLIAVGAYFYPQTEEQAGHQPASVTGVAALYTNNDSRAVVLGHQSYWNEDTWRLGGAVGYADLNLTLLLPDELLGRDRVDWNINGNIAFAKLSYKTFGNWYTSVFGRWMDIDQQIGLGTSPDGFGADPQNFDLDTHITTAGLGLAIENDTRDLPINTYEGHKFELSALFNEESLGSDNNYQSYKIEYNSYHELSRPIVIAWQLIGCVKNGKVPIWDACRVPLRGFSALDHLGERSLAAQIEARWRLNDRWGLVAFTGGGSIYGPVFPTREEIFVPSYGMGIRFSVLQKKRINLRFDYARSLDSSAAYLSVGEAF